MYIYTNLPVPYANIQQGKLYKARFYTGSNMGAYIKDEEGKQRLVILDNSQGLTCSWLQNKGTWHILSFMHTKHIKESDHA